MKNTYFESASVAELIYDELEPEIFPMYEEIFGDEVPPVSWIAQNILDHIEDALEENPNLQRHIMLSPKARRRLLDEIESVIAIAEMDLREEE